MCLFEAHVYVGDRTNVSRRYTRAGALGDRLRIIYHVLERYIYNKLVDPASNICLSQRLSHACLSAAKMNSETANGSLNQL